MEGQENFGAETPFALGVEEELLLVGDDRGLLEHGDEVVRDADPQEGEVVGELFKAMVESNSDVSRNAAEATEALSQIRRRTFSHPGPSRLMPRPQVLLCRSVKIVGM